jgi:hypothetical protein
MILCYGLSVNHSKIRRRCDAWADDCIASFLDVLPWAGKEGHCRTTFGGHDVLAAEERMTVFLYPWFFLATTMTNATRYWQLMSIHSERYVCHRTDGEASPTAPPSVTCGNDI